jgi:hypothetical protein
MVLSVGLELAGFSVWRDLDCLKGGDYFWDKIERAIRYESYRFLAVVSTVAVDKQVQRLCCLEWNVGHHAVKRRMLGRA